MHYFYFQYFHNWAISLMEPQMAVFFCPYFSDVGPRRLTNRNLAFLYFIQSQAQKYCFRKSWTKVCWYLIKVKYTVTKGLENPCLQSKIRFGFYGPFKNILLISSRSLTRGGQKLGYLEKNHLTYWCRTGHLPCTPSEARTTAARDPMFKNQRRLQRKKDNEHVEH